MEIELKEDWKEFERILKINDINSLYHITDESNLDSIFKRGFLCSTLYSNQNRIRVSMPGGNRLSRKLDYHHGVYNFVHLFFWLGQPMIENCRRDGRMPNPRYLEFKTSIIFHKTTKFCPTNAAVTNSDIGDTLDTFKKIRFDIKRYNINSSEYKSFIQAEVLYYEKLSLEYLI